MPIVSDRYRGTKEYALVYCELLNAARHRGTVTYQEIAEIMGLPTSGQYMGQTVGKILSEINEDELENGRPLLTAIAVRVDGYPGAGFFSLAREMGRLQSTAKEDERRFWEEEVQAVYKTWQKSFAKD